MLFRSSEGATFIQCQPEPSQPCQYFFFLKSFTAFSFSYSVSKLCRSFFIADMNVDVAQILAKGLKAHKRKGAATSGLAKKVRVEETSSVVLAQAATVIDAPSLS